MLFDAHSDLLYDVTRRRLLGETRVLERCHLDRLRRGGIEGLVLSVWTGIGGGETFWKDTPWGGPGQDRERTEQMLSCTRQELAACPPLRVVRTAREAEEARQAGVLYAFLGVEGMAAAGGDPAAVDAWADWGARMAMLTWNEENAFATGAGGDPDKGLTAAGREAVRRMQKRGVLTDVSHLNDGGFWDVLKLAQGPVIASHSNCRCICDVRRNLTDDQLRAIQDTGGVVGLNVYRNFVHREPAEQTARTLALHAAHMAEVMGVDHVGCGFDYCEFMGGPGNEGAEGLEDASQSGNLFYWLEKLGMTPEERERIARKNFLRLLA